MISGDSMALVSGRLAATLIAASTLLLAPLFACSPAPAAVEPDDPSVNTVFDMPAAKSGRIYGYVPEIETREALAGLFSATGEVHVAAARSLAAGDRDSALAVLDGALDGAATDKQHQLALLREIGALTFVDGDERPISAYTQLMTLEPSGSTSYLLTLLHLRNGRVTKGALFSRFPPANDP